jgi:hypothetical protein
VLLLSEKDSKTCPAMTGRVGEHLFHGECTVLVGADKCDGRFTVGVIGARGAYRLVEGKALSDEKAQASLLRVVAKGRAVEAASERWKEALGKHSFGESIRNARSWPGLEGAPTLVQLTVTGVGIGGPWVAISHGTVAAMVGAFGMGDPVAFVLDGRSYLRFDVAYCTDCGDVATELYLVDAGKLVLVLRSTANNN